MIFLDIDGVFADYRKGFFKILGRDYHTDPKSAWPILDKEPNLFAKLEPLPNARLLFEHIKVLAENYDQGISFLTACPLETGYLTTAKADKTEWVRKYLDFHGPVVCTPGWKYKKAYARVGSILIDDSARNIRDWCSAGGVGILHFDNEVTIKTLSLLLED